MVERFLETLGIPLASGRFVDGSHFLFFDTDQG